MNGNTRRFRVSGLKCQGCVARAHTALTEISGFVAAEIDLSTGQAEVTGEIDPESVCAVLSNAGYPTSVADG